MNIGTVIRGTDYQGQASPDDRVCMAIDIIAAG